MRVGGAWPGAAAESFAGGGVVGAGGLFQVGDAGSTSHGLGADDLFVSGDLEVDGLSFFDGVATLQAPILNGPSITGTPVIKSNLWYHNDAGNLASYVAIGASVDDGWLLAIGDIENRTNRNLIITDLANKTADHGHDTLSPHPTVWLHSLLDPAVDGTEYTRLRFAASLFGAGKGAFLGLKSMIEELTIPIGQGAAGVPTVGNLAPANSRILDAVVRVTQGAGGGATAFDLGVTGGNLNGLIDALAVALDTEGNSIADNDGVQTFPIENAAATTLTVTTDLNVTGADLKVRIAVWYQDLTPPAA